MADSGQTGCAHIRSAGFHLYPASFIVLMTAWLGLSSGRPSPNMIATWRSCLLSKSRTPATLSFAMPNGSGADTHFLCPTLSAKLWLFSLGSAAAASVAGGSATVVVVSVDSCFGVRLRDIRSSLSIRGYSLAL